MSRPVSTMSHMASTPTLSAEQHAAVAQLSRYKVGALFMAPGTGKTRTAVELMRGLGADVQHVLWLAPYRTIHPRVAGTGVREEVAKWGGLHVPVTYCAIETLSNSNRTYLELLDKVSASPSAVVLDESLKIKNWEAVRTQRIIMIGRKAEYRLLLNGTPISRNLLDLWAQMEFLSPRILKMGRAQFKNTFCEYVTMTKRVGFRTIRREWITRYHNVEHLYKLIEPYVYECDLQLALKQNWYDLRFWLDEAHREEYRRIKEKYLSDEVMEARNSNIFLEMTTKMQHTYSCSRDKFRALERVLDQHDPARVIVYTRFVDARQAIASRWPGLLVLSLQSEAMGLNLQARNVTVFWDKTWDYALLDQAMHRTWRTGQTEPCHFYTLTGDVKLEDLIDRNVARKESLLTYFKQHSVEELRKRL
jgi:SNF2 family DNA or RNA helicase